MRAFLLGESFTNRGILEPHKPINKKVRCIIALVKLPPADLKQWWAR